MVSWSSDAFSINCFNKSFSSFFFFRWEWTKGTQNATVSANTMASVVISIMVIKDVPTVPSNAQRDQHKCLRDRTDLWKDNNSYIKVFLACQPVEKITRNSGKDRWDRWTQNLCRPPSIKNMRLRRCFWGKQTGNCLHWKNECSSYRHLSYRKACYRHCWS